MRSRLWAGLVIVALSLIFGAASGCSNMPVQHVKPSALMKKHGHAICADCGIDASGASENSLWTVWTATPRPAPQSNGKSSSFNNHVGQFLHVLGKHLGAVIYRPRRPDGNLRPVESQSAIQRASNTPREKSHLLLDNRHKPLDRRSSIRFHSRSAIVVDFLPEVRPEVLGHSGKDVHETTTTPHKTPPSWTRKAPI